MSFSDYEYGFQANPIILEQGIASTGAMSIAVLLQSFNYKTGITAKASPTSFEFASFRPLPGHTLIQNEVATYPVANQTVAANAVITDPLTISMEMIVPASATVTVSTKLAIITSLKQALDNHTAQGGWYNVCTPSFIYTGCLLTSLVDASDDGYGVQPQVRWIWNFMQPLITSSSLATQSAALSPSMNTITKQTKNVGDPPGSQYLKTNFGLSSSNISQNFVPANIGTVGANIAPTTSSNTSSSLSSISPISFSG